MFVMGVNFHLVVIYASLLVVAMVYAYIWQQLYDKSLESQLIIDTPSIKALHIPFYFLLVLYGIRASIPYIPEWFLTQLALSPSNFTLFFPLGFTLWVLWGFNRTLSNIQAHIIAIEKNEEVPNASAWISACKFGRIISVLVFSLVMMYQLKIPMGQFMAPTAVFAFGLSFASKDILSNVFGGLMVLCDRPFSVGDYVVIGHNEEGTVRYIGWRVTEIQLRNGRILHVPNGLITNSVVTNYSEKTHWFVQKEFEIRFEDFPVAGKIASELSEWINAHVHINRRRGGFAHVFDYGDAGLKIRVRAYLKSSLNTKQWYEFVEDLLVEIDRVICKNKADYASFPCAIMSKKAKRGYSG